MIWKGRAPLYAGLVLYGMREGILVTPRFPSVHFFGEMDCLFLKHLYRKAWVFAELQGLDSWSIGEPTKSQCATWHTAFGHLRTRCCGHCGGVSVCLLVSFCLVWRCLFFCLLVCLFVCLSVCSVLFWNLYGKICWSAAQGLASSFNALFFLVVFCWTTELLQRQVSLPCRAWTLQVHAFSMLGMWVWLVERSMFSAELLVLTRHVEAGGKILGWQKVLAPVFSKLIQLVRPLNLWLYKSQQARDAFIRSFLCMESPERSFQHSEADWATT